MMDANQIAHQAHQIEKLHRVGNYDNVLSLLKDLEHARVTVELLQETDVAKVLYRVLKSCPVATVKKTVKLLLSKWKKLFSETHLSTGSCIQQKCKAVELAGVTEENRPCPSGDASSPCDGADCSVLQGEQCQGADNGVLQEEQRDTGDVITLEQSLSDPQAQQHRTHQGADTEKNAQNASALGGGGNTTAVSTELFPKGSSGTSTVTPLTHVSQAEATAPVRAKCVQLLLQALAPESAGGAKPAPQCTALAHSIEEHVFALHGADLTKYKACVRSKVINLRNPKSPHLRQDLLSAQLTPEAFARMTVMEMASQELRELRGQYTASGIREHQRPLGVEGTPTDKIRCRHCNGFDCRVTQISRGTLFLPGWVRSGGSDGDMMTFVTCAICGEKWYHSAWVCL